MHTSIRVLATALAWTGICACGQADNAADDSADTTASTTDTAAMTVSDSAGSTTQSAGSVALQPTAQAPVTSPVTKTASTQPSREDAARIAAARADSLRLAQAPATARIADSVKQADAAKAAAALPTVPRETAPAPTVNLAAQGKVPYDANCKKCHGASGVPAKAMQAKFPKLKAFDAAFFATRSADSVVAVLMKGTSSDMKSYKDKLSHDEMVAVAAYIRGFAKL